MILFFYKLTKICSMGTSNKMESMMDTNKMASLDIIRI